MKSSSLRRGLQAAVVALALGGAVPSYAVPLMDMRAEDLLPMASELRKTLNLNANQQTLWQQVENRSRAILRERQSRRERMQQQVKTMLENAVVELRDVSALVDAESALASAEDKQLRELWLTVNDALDDGQRRKVAAMLAEQMMRVPDNGQHGGQDRPRGEGGDHRRAGGAGHGRGGMGMPGS